MANEPSDTTKKLNVVDEYFKDKMWLYWIIICGLAASFIGPILACIFGNISTIGQLGDSYNILGTFLNAATLIFLALTFQSQKESFKTQQLALINQDIELKEQGKMMKEQQDVMRQQLEEMKYSRNLEIVKAIIESIKSDLSNITYTSYDEDGVQHKVFGTQAMIAAINQVEEVYETVEFAAFDPDEVKENWMHETIDIVHKIIAVTNIASKDESTKVLISCSIPLEFSGFCIVMSGGINNKDPKEQSFRWQFNRIPEWVWERHKSKK